MNYRIKCGIVSGMIFLSWLIPEKIVRQEAEIELPPEYPTYLQSIEKKEEKPPYLGEWKVTVYTPYCDDGVWGYETASGETSKHLETCAVDPSIVPLGSVLDVSGLSVRAVDTGSAVKGNVVDIFFDGTKQEAMEWIAEFGDTAHVWMQEEVREEK